MQSKISVLQVIPQLDVSGASQGCIDVANYLEENHHNSVVMTHSGKREKDIKKKGTKVILSPVHSKNPLVILLNIFRILKAVNDHSIDIIHVRSRAPAWSCYFASKIAGKKLVSTFHGTYNFNNFIKKFYNSIMLRTDGTIAISHFIENEIKDKYPPLTKNLKVIPRGIDTTVFNPKNISQDRMDQIMKKYLLESDSIKLLLPGRFSNWKGHVILVQAVAEVIQKIKTKVEVMFVGPDENSSIKQSIINKIESLNLGNFFHFLGSTDEMASIYAISDIVVSSSTDPEAFGRIAVESQAMGKFVVASNHGGSTETVINNETGFLYPPQDYQELANMIIKAIDQKKYNSSEVSKAGIKNVVDNYSVESMCKQTLEFYKKILS